MDLKIEAWLSSHENCPYEVQGENQEEFVLQAMSKFKIEFFDMRWYIFLVVDDYRYTQYSEYLVF